MKRNQIVIILNNIRSTLNVGAMLRTADAILAEKVYMCGITATPLHPKVIKTSLGAENTVPWEYQEDVVGLVRNLKSTGYQLVCLELGDKSVSFWEDNYKDKVALLVGNEVEGISNNLVNICDIVVSIPMLGHKESLNVATALGIVSYEILRQQIVARNKFK